MTDFRLKSFLEVVRRGSFSAAAEALYLTQPAVSQHIASLEESYGRRLIGRSGRSAVPTPAGALLYRYAQKVEALYVQMDRDMANLHQQVRSYDVGATLTVAEYVMPGLIGAYRRANDQVKIRLSVQNTESTVELLRRNRLVFGVVEGPFDAEDLLHKSLRTDELVAVCAPGHPLASGVPRRGLPLKTLLESDIILREPGSGTREVFERYLSSRGLRGGLLHPLMEIGSNNAIKALVISELGVTVISRLVVAGELRTGTLVELPLEGPRILRQFSFIWTEYSDAEFVEDFRAFAGASSVPFASTT